MNAAKISDLVSVAREVSADMKYLMGRASKEGHDAGQSLAAQTSAKLDRMTATPSQRVEKARRKAVSTSGKSRHDVILPPLAVAALGRLVGRGYAGSVTAAIARALVDADAGLMVSPE